jgi:quinoprotein glucose dehydrogenase
MIRPFSIFQIALLFIVTVESAVSQDEYKPKIADASKDAELALKGFRLPENVQGSLLAAEPMLANPVCFTITNDGRIIVCETFRQEVGVEDNRGHMNWLENDLQLQSVEERAAMFRRYMGDDVQKWAKEHDRLRMLTDTDGDGVLDRDTVFADGFNNIVDGTGAGVIEHNGRICYTCIPNVWSFADTNGDGVADDSQLLHHGYGVRVAFRGHDLHGLVVGPDGRIYFSIGDRGYNVITKEGTRLKRVDTGAVFRCDADGSHLEVFAHGLRNPQELAFDDNGNLFTGDNNSDSGDKARWVYVVQDGDTGWRMYYQYLDDRGPWNRERIWYPYRADEETSAVQPAAILPPIANLGDGPSGLTFYPGIGLPDRYKGHFFMADFRGTAGNSGIRSFTNTPKGATFELYDSHEFIWSILATDVTFAPDASMVVSDWVNGWNGEGKGRLYRFAHEVDSASAKVADSAKLLGGGIKKSKVTDLLKLLQHPDRRVRSEAQFELVRRNEFTELMTTVRTADNDVAKLHGLWGCWQHGLSSADNANAVNAMLFEILSDRTSGYSTELQTQAIRIMTDIVSRHGFAAVAGELRVNLASVCSELTKRDEMRLAGFAAVAVGTIGTSDDAKSLLALLDRNNNIDPVVRHQATMGIVKLAERQPGLLEELADYAGTPGRLGVLLAMRRQGNAAISQFLKDGDSSLVAEAARAINDEPIDAAQSALADLLATPGLDDNTLRRSLNACYRRGLAGDAASVATCRGRS